MNGSNGKGKEERFDRVFYGGISIGLIVFITGILTTYWHIIGIVESRLILCAGLGFLMGTFGSTGVIKYRNITITGVAAIAIILSYVVVRQSAQFVTFGTITGDLKDATIGIWEGNNHLLGATTAQGDYDFVVKDRINRPFFDIIITFPANRRAVPPVDETEIPFKRIENKYINDVIDAGGTIWWRFNRKEERIEAGKGHETIASRELPGPSASQKPEYQKDWLMVNKAFAQDSSKSLQDIFVDLASGSNEVRRVARSDLAARGPNAVSATMQEYRKHQNIYQLRLGILVALTEMLRNNKKLAPQVSQQLSNEDLQLLVRALTDNDRTIRIYAGEFLYDLGDPRVAPLALESAKTGNTDEGRYLSVFAIKGAYPKLSESEKRSTREQLETILPTSGEKTQQLIKSFK